MNPFRPTLLALGAGLLLPAMAAESRPIFNGRNLEGWRGDPEVWRVEEGAIRASIAAGERLPNNEFLYWEGGEPADFELVLEFRIVGGPGANSGIQIRSAEDEGGHAIGYQADLDQGATWLGRIYDEHGRKLLLERGHQVSIAPDGERYEWKFAEPDSFKDLLRPGEAWNEYRITAVGPRIEIEVNGELLSVLEDRERGEADAAGKIAVQLHSGEGPVELAFRNIRLREFERAEAEEGKPGEVGERPERLDSSPVLSHLVPNPAGADAGETVAGMWVAPGFEVERIAGEPDLRQPIAFTIDERGRLWVVEAHSYPERRDKGLDRILIFEDGNGDGKFETRKTFAEGLNLVSGIEVGFGGVWVGAAPELLFIPDRNGDDVPDGEPQVLLDGWGFADTHETLNSFTWGVDGWLYGVQGVFVRSEVGKPGTPDEERETIKACVWRYHPTEHVFEVFARGGSNQWGLDFDAEGQLFMTHCRSFWGGGPTTWVIPGGHYWNQVNRGHIDFVSSEKASFRSGEPRLLENYLPSSATVGHGEGGAGEDGSREIYGGHSHVGTMIYQGDNWPREYRGHLFTHNLHGHQMNRQFNQAQGAGYLTLPAGGDPLLVPDERYVGVDLDYGPDGSVYMIDWYDEQHCHNTQVEKWDRSNGRIYRMKWAADWRPRSVDLRQASDLELVAHQGHENAWYARTARRLLQERAAAGELDSGAVAKLREEIDGAEEASALLRRLWTLEVTAGVGVERLRALARHRHESVRAWALRLLRPRLADGEFAASELIELAASEASPRVRLEMATLLPELDGGKRWRLAEELAAHEEDRGDRWLPKMIWFGIAPATRDEPARALELAGSTPLTMLADSIVWYLAGDAGARERLLARFGEAEPERRERVAELLLYALQDGGAVEEPEAWAAWSEALAGSGRDEAVELGLLLDATFGDAGAVGRIRESLLDEELALERREQRLGFLDRIGDREGSATYLQLLDDEEMAAEVIPILGRFDEPAVAKGLVAALDRLEAADRSLALSALSSRPALATALLESVLAKETPKSHLTSLQVREMSKLDDEEVDRLLERAWGRVGEVDEDVAASIERYRDLYQEAPKWAYEEDEGAKLFEAVCAACHKMDGKGGDLGPELTGSWRNGLDYFLESIVAPNGVVGEDYQLHVFSMKDGSVVSGMLVEEGPEQLKVGNTLGVTVVRREDVESSERFEQSVMPAGLLDGLEEKQVVELLKYLLEPDEE